MNEMTFEQLFDQSFDRVNSTLVDSISFFDAFYDRFLRSSKEVADKFKDTDMTKQQKMLKRSFYSLVTFFATYKADHSLEKIAIKHNRAHLDIRPELYDLWLECLIDTAREFDSEFTEELELVWRLVMMPGIVYMKFHYDKTEE
ncbi:hypothetical protein QP938_03845 [Porticoccaceae bacterium LTM1]|nr:hypothetical protein QP938_03845 [Porticoccaceae bacterium LTM1]